VELPLESLRALCDRLRDELGAAGCLVSRVIGDVLVLVAEDRALRDSRIGRVFLIPDFPATRRVLEERVALGLSVEDDDADPHEVAVLGDLGFWSLLMLPLEVEGEVWGLVEVYGEPGRAFDDADAGRALALVHAAAPA
jgi:hypothetical protein